MKRLNVFSRFMAEVTERGGILRTPIHMIIILALMLIAALGFTPQSHAQVNPGDTLVIDQSTGTGGLGALFRVNPTTGNRTVISDFGNSAQGTLGFEPFGVAIVPPQPRLGDILVIDPFAGVNNGGALFSVDLFSGVRSLISNFGMSAQGTVATAPVAVAVDASGNLLSINPFSGTNGRGALFRVNPANGFRTLLSDFGNSTQGPVGEDPYGLAVESSGNILVIDLNAGTNGKGALFRVNPSNGSRTVASDFNNSVQGALGEEPIGVAIESSGNILVIDLDAGTVARGALFRVNPSNGSRTILTDFGAPGVSGVNPTGVAIESSGMILVIDQSAGTGSKGALFRINPSNGSRTVVSDFGIPNQGPLGATPTGVAIGSSGMILVTDPNAGGTPFTGALFGVNPSGGSRVLISIVHSKQNDGFVIIELWGRSRFMKKRKLFLEDT